MKISWGHVGVAAVSIAVLAGAYRLSPAMRTAVATQSGEWLGWTEDARRADPAGFTKYDVNERVLRDNPVRSVAELMADESRGTPSALASHEAARRFLEEAPLPGEPLKTPMKQEIEFAVEFETTPTAEFPIQQQQSAPVSKSE